MRKGSYFTPSELALFNAQTPIFNGSQMKIVNRKTPPSEVEVKKDKSNFTYKSVKAAYVKALVTLVTGGKFDFEIISEEFIQATKEVKVKARLTIHVGGKTYKREQFGQHYLISKLDTENDKNTTFPADIGNGYKAAASDAFKKCASEFGFCWDIYGQEHADKKKEEAPEGSYDDKKKLERLEHFLAASNNADEIEGLYNTYLETADETEASKAILQKHYDRVLKRKD